MPNRSRQTRVGVGAAARRRIQAGGARARGRPAATREEWTAIRLIVLRRARLRCQACGRWGALEVHHVIKRAQGGSDFDLDRLVALCPPCHAQTDAPYARGRLVITARGQGRFTCEVIQGADKWVIRPQEGPASQSSDPTLGWRKVAADVNVVSVPGNHTQLSPLAQNTTRRAVVLHWHVLVPEPATNPI